MLKSILIGRALTPSLTRFPEESGIRGKITQAPGFAGIKKVPSDLVITPLMNTNQNGKNYFMLSIISKSKEDLHISSFKIDFDKLKRIYKDNFWVLQDQEIQRP